MRNPIATGILLAAAAGLAPASASPRELLVCAPGFPGTPEQARAVMDALARAIESGAGWPAGSVLASYTPVEADGLAALEARKPPFVLATLPFWLEHRERLPGRLVASARLAREATERFRLLARPPAKEGEGPGALRGKRLTGTRIEDPVFVSRLLLGGALDVAKDCTLVPQARTLRAVKAVGAGEADAVLLSEEEWRLLQTEELKPRVAGLATVHVSPPIPTAPVVAVEGRAAPAEADALARALEGLSGTEAGRALCEKLRVTGFGPADPALYEAAFKLYRPPPPEGEAKKDAPALR